MLAQPLSNLGSFTICMRFDPIYTINVVGLFSSPRLDWGNSCRHILELEWGTRVLGYPRVHVRLAGPSPDKRTPLGSAP